MKSKRIWNEEKSLKFWANLFPQLKKLSLAERVPICVLFDFPHTPSELMELE